MITASERLVPHPGDDLRQRRRAARSAGSARAAGCRTSAPSRSSVGSMPRTPSIVFSRIGNRQKNAMKRDLLLVADRVQQDDRDRQQRRRRHRAPVLDVRHRQLARPAREPDRDPERDAERRPRSRSRAAIRTQARHDVQRELREEPHVLELDEDRRRAAGSSRCPRCDRPQLPDARGSRAARRSPRRPASVVGARLTRPPPAATGCQRSTRRSSAAMSEVHRRARGSRWRARARTAESSGRRTARS